MRLLTIHSAKGLEFKVVVVADAGRNPEHASRDEILCLPDGRVGFKIVDPSTGKRHAASGFDELREADGTLSEILLRLQAAFATAGALDSELWCIDGTTVRAARCAGGGEKK